MQIFSSGASIVAFAAAAGVVAGVGCACLARPVAARRNGQILALGRLVGDRR